MCRILLSAATLEPAVLPSLVCQAVENDEGLPSYTNAWWNALDSQDGGRSQRLEVLADALAAFDRDRAMVTRATGIQSQEMDGDTQLIARNILLDAQAQLRERVHNIVNEMDQIRGELEDHLCDAPLEPPQEIVRRARKKMLILEKEKWLDTRETHDK